MPDSETDGHLLSKLWTNIDLLRGWEGGELSRGADILCYIND